MGPRFTASCACGQVVVDAKGAPVVSAICYCADCQEGARRIEALPGAAPIVDAEGGTPYLLFRRDRVSCSQGAHVLTRHKLREGSPTNRVVASCCNSAMLVNFDKGPFWVSVYRDRLAGDLPPAEIRICTKSRRAVAASDADIPSYSGYPARFIMRLLVAGAPLLFSGKRGAGEKLGAPA